MAIGRYIIGYNAFGIINVYITGVKRFTWLLSPKQGRLICSRSALKSPSFLKRYASQICCRITPDVRAICVSLRRLLTQSCHT